MRDAHFSNHALRDRPATRIALSRDPARPLDDDGPALPDLRATTAAATASSRPARNTLPTNVCPDTPA
jgi:hypothetical protein